MAQTRTGKVKKRRQLRNTFRLSVILLIFIMSIVISFVIYALKFDISSVPVDSIPEKSGNGLMSGLSENNPDIEDSTLTDSQNKNNDLTPETTDNKANPISESEKKDESYLEKTVFIGDSVTTGLSGYKFVSPENVLASVGLRIDNVMTEKVQTPALGQVSVIDALSSISPENVYIMLGLNGVSWYDVNNGNRKMLDAYSDFIDKIKETLPQTDVYIISLTPVGTKKESIATAEEGRVLNTEIDVFNQKLLELANEKKVYYVDANSHLKGANGKLPDEWTSDGMHLTKEAYQKYIDYILTHTI